MTRLTDVLRKTVPLEDFAKHLMDCFLPGSTITLVATDVTNFIPLETYAVKISGIIRPTNINSTPEHVAIEGKGDSGNE